jgi:hypothetical protein
MALILIGAEVGAVYGKRSTGLGGSANRNASVSVASYERSAVDLTCLPATRRHDGASERNGPGACR